MATRRKTISRAGLASLDYVMILAYVVVPIVLIVSPLGQNILRLAYEMVCVLISWPFM